MRQNEFKNCCFCKEKIIKEKPHDNDELYWIECPICGYYLISYIEFDEVDKKGALGAFHLNCTAENIKAQKEGIKIYWYHSRGGSKKPPSGCAKCISKKWDYYEAFSIQHSKKPDEILKFLSEKASSPFDGVRFSLRDIYLLKMDGWGELSKWSEELHNEKLIYCKSIYMWKKNNENIENKFKQEQEKITFSLTPKGLIHLEKYYSGISSKKVFIAMSFKVSDREEIETAVKEACDEAGGWEAITIDNVEYLGGITDEIIAKINQSAFVIADFTENRHGVYFEAGYAHGLGKPVIYTIRDKTELKNAHFDTKHLNHIVWNNNYKNLKTSLINRINAVINK